MGIIYGSIIGVIKGDTRSLDYSSYLCTLIRILVVAGWEVITTRRVGGTR